MAAQGDRNKKPRPIGRGFLFLPGTQARHLADLLGCASGCVGSSISSLLGGFSGSVHSSGSGFLGGLGSILGGVGSSAGSFLGGVDSGSSGFLGCVSSFGGGCGSGSFHRCGSRSRSGLFLLAASGKSGSSDEGSQNDGVLHFNFL